MIRKGIMAGIDRAVPGKGIKRAVRKTRRSLIVPERRSQKTW